MEWIENKKENWPTDINNNEHYLFVKFHKGIDIIAEYGTWQDIKDFHKYELQNEYTHFIKIQKPPA